MPLIFSFINPKLPLANEPIQLSEFDGINLIQIEFESVTPKCFFQILLKSVFFLIFHNSFSSIFYIVWLPPNESLRKNSL